MAQTYLQALATDARCFSCLTGLQKLQIQAYLFAYIMGSDVDPASWATRVKCLNCLTRLELLQIKVYLLAQMAGFTTNASDLVGAAKCYTCFEHGEVATLQTYLLSQDPAGPGITSPTALAQVVSGFSKFNSKTLLQIEVYALATVGNQSTDAATLRGLASCMLCVPFPLLAAIALQVIDFLEPIPTDSPRDGSTPPTPPDPPPPPPGNPPPGRGGGIPVCSDTAANLIPVLTPTYVAGSLTTVTALVPRTCCKSGKLAIVGSNSVDMTGFVTLTTVNEPNRTGNWTSAAIDLSGYAYNFFAAQSDCQNGKILSSFSNVVGKTWLPQDSMQSYTNGIALNGLNGGATWSGAFVDRATFNSLIAYDTMESYTNGAAVNGLNAGTGWNGAYVT